MNKHKNQSCPYCQHNNPDHIKLHEKKKQRFKCLRCQRTWVPHIKEAHYKLRYTPQQINRAHLLIKHGYSIRQVAKFLKVSPSTIQRWKKRHKQDSN